jgi:lauroyl/myristoyl acyltransferase
VTDTSSDGPRRPVREATSAAALAFRVGAAALVSWVVPSRLWLPITRALGRLAVRYGSDPGSASAAVAAERIATGHASRLYGLRLYLPGSHGPPIELRGADRLQRTLEHGNGAILWVARFAFAPLLFKIALKDAGYAVSHLSRPTHGFGVSPFAVRWLNPIWTRIEERYVHERLVMEPGAETAALRTLRRRLEDNRVVSITVGDEAVRTVEVGFLEATLRIATGPINLAMASGAFLLPVFTVRESDGAFVVVIDAPLDTTVSGDRAQRFQAIAGQYAERLGPYVRRYPGQWIG